MYAVMNSNRVRQLRKQRGMNRRDLATQAGISESTARRVERGSPVQASTVWKVAGVFGLEARDIARPVHQRVGRARLYLVG